MTDIAGESPMPPWYRQFWPWFLIALPGSVVIASLVTLVLAVRSHDPLLPETHDGAMPASATSSSGTTVPD